MVGYQARLYCEIARASTSKCSGRRVDDDSAWRSVVEECPRPVRRGEGGSLRDISCYVTARVELGCAHDKSVATACYVGFDGSRTHSTGCPLNNRGISGGSQR